MLCLHPAQDDPAQQLITMQQKMTRTEDRELLQQLQNKCALCLHATTPKGLLKHWPIERTPEWNIHGHYCPSLKDAKGLCLFCGQPGDHQQYCMEMRQFAMLQAERRGTPSRGALVDKMFHCEHCGQSYLTKPGLTAHVAKYHADRPPSLTDNHRSLLTNAVIQDECQLLLDRPDLLERPDVTCGLCEHECVNRAMLKRHLKQNHAQYWPQAADLELQLMQQHCPDQQCYCRPSNPKKHTCVIFSQFAVLRLHCLRAPEEATASDLMLMDKPPPPPLNISALAMTALDLGAVTQLLKSPVNKEFLSRTCLLCGDIFNLAKDLVQHLQTNHQDDSTHHEYLVDILFNSVGTTLGRVCHQPPRQPEPRQLALAHRKSDHCLLVAHTFDASILGAILHPWMQETLLRSIQHRLMTRKFESLLQDPTIHELMRSHCILCGSQENTRNISQHMQADHPTAWEHAQIFAPTPHGYYSTVERITNICPLCHLPLQELPAADLILHFAGACPLIRQYALLFTLPLHVQPAALPHQQLQVTSSARATRQLTLRERLVGTSAPPEGDHVVELIRLTYRILTDQWLLHAYSSHCSICDQYFVIQDNMLTHLHQHINSEYMVNTCYQMLLELHGPQSLCALCSLPHTQNGQRKCVVLWNLAVLLQHGGRLRDGYGHARKDRKSVV